MIMQVTTLNVLVLILLSALNPIMITADRIDGCKWPKLILKYLNVSKLAANH